MGFAEVGIIRDLGGYADNVDTAGEDRAHAAPGLCLQGLRAAESPHQLADVVQGLSILVVDTKVEVVLSEVLNHWLGIKAFMIRWATAERIETTLLLVL